MLHCATKVVSHSSVAQWYAFNNLFCIYNVDGHMNFVVMIFARKNKFYLFTNLFSPRYQYTRIHGYWIVNH